MDLASYQDIAALVFVFPEDDGSLAIFGYFFLPEKIAEESGNDHYAGWANAGKIITTPGNMIDHDAIMNEILLARDNYNILSILFDTTQAAPLVNQLTEEGFQLERFKQWAENYSEPMKRSAALMDDGKLYHPYYENDPMSWMISNVVSKPNKKEQDYPDKERPELKIDGPVAMLMAIAGVLNNTDTTSPYEDHGVWCF
jgi:phage terminase large subunit-like protein